jgi:hypothetical protein
MGSRADIVKSLSYNSRSFFRGVLAHSDKLAQGKEMSGFLRRNPGVEIVVKIRGYALAKRLTARKGRIIAII